MLSALATESLTTKINSQRCFKDPKQSKVLNTSIILEPNMKEYEESGPKKEDGRGYIELENNLEKVFDKNWYENLILNTVDGLVSIGALGGSAYATYQMFNGEVSHAYIFWAIGGLIVFSEVLIGRLGDKIVYERKMW